MRKPENKVILNNCYDYHECDLYISSLLGYNLRDTLGKWTDKEKKEVEYRDFWHFLCHEQEISNPCFIIISSGMKDRANDWQCEIIDAFIKEFGEDTEYFVRW